VIVYCVWFTSKINYYDKDDDDDDDDGDDNDKSIAFVFVVSTDTDVDTRPPPIIYHGPQNQTLPVNSVATLSCSASGEPAPVISWYRNQRMIPSRDHRFTILQSGALQITGTYTNLSF